MESLSMIKIIYLTCFALCTGIEQSLAQPVREVAGGIYSQVERAAAKNVPELISQRPPHIGLPSIPEAANNHPSIFPIPPLRISIPKPGLRKVPTLAALNGDESTLARAGNGPVSLTPEQTKIWLMHSSSSAEAVDARTTNHQQPTSSEGLSIMDPQLSINDNHAELPKLRSASIDAHTAKRVRISPPPLPGRSNELLDFLHSPITFQPSEVKVGPPVQKYIPGGTTPNPQAFSTHYYERLQILSGRWRKVFEIKEEDFKIAFREYFDNLPKDYFDKKFYDGYLTGADFKAAYEEYIKYTTLERTLKNEPLDVKLEAVTWAEQYGQFKIEFDNLDHLERNRLKWASKWGSTDRVVLLTREQNNEKALNIVKEKWLKAQREKANE